MDAALRDRLWRTLYYTIDLKSTRPVADNAIQWGIFGSQPDAFWLVQSHFFHN